MHQTIRSAKQDWAENVLTEATNNQDQNALWAVAKWCKGRSNPIIPPIHMAENDVSADHARMSGAFQARFFPDIGITVDVVQPDDPAPIPPWPHLPVTEDKICHCLVGMSNSSAPGLSGISYKFIKWAFAVRPDSFVHLFNLCLSQGTHPWKEAKVVILPK
jgi:hypothetical protein